MAADITTPPDTLNPQVEAAAQQQQMAPMTAQQRADASAAWLAQNRPDLVSRPSASAEEAAAMNLAYRTNQLPVLPKYAAPPQGSPGTEMDLTRVYIGGTADVQGTPMDLTRSQYIAMFGRTPEASEEAKYQAFNAPINYGAMANLTLGQIASRYGDITAGRVQDYYAAHPSARFLEITAQYESRQQYSVGGGGMQYQPTATTVRNPFPEDSAAGIAWISARQSGGQVTSPMMQKAELESKMLYGVPFSSTVPQQYSEGRLTGGKTLAGVAIVSGQETIPIRDLSYEATQYGGGGNVGAYYQQLAWTAVATRPGYTAPAQLGDTTTQRLVAGYTAFSQVMGMTGVSLASPTTMTGQVLETQRQMAYATPQRRDETFYMNELQKWGQNYVEISSAYHHVGIEAGVPIPANPFEYQGDLAVEFLKGAPQKDSERFSPVSGEMGRHLPGGEGIQQYAWKEAVYAYRRGEGLPYSQPERESFMEGVRYLGAAEGLYGPYGKLWGGVDTGGVESRVVSFGSGRLVGGGMVAVTEATTQALQVTTVMQPSQFDLFAMQANVPVLSGAAVATSDFLFSGTGPIAAMAKSGADVFRSVGIGPGGEALFTRYMVTTETGAAIQGPVTSSMSTPITEYTINRDGSVTATTTATVTESGSVITPVTIKQVPIMGGFEYGSQQLSREIISMTPEIPREFGKGTPWEYNIELARGAYEGLREKPLEAVAWAGIGGFMVAGGMAIGSLGAATVAATEGTALAPIAVGTHWFASTAAPVMLTGLYGADVFQRSTQAHLYTETPGAPLGLNLQADFSPKSTYRFGEIFATETGPMILGGAAVAYGPSAIRGGISRVGEAWRTTEIPSPGDVYRGIREGISTRIRSYQLERGQPVRMTGEDVVAGAVRTIEAEFAVKSELTTGGVSKKEAWRLGEEGTVSFGSIERKGPSDVGYQEFWGTTNKILESEVVSKLEYASKYGIYGVSSSAGPSVLNPQFDILRSIGAKHGYDVGIPVYPKGFGETPYAIVKRMTPESGGKVVGGAVVFEEPLQIGAGGRLTPEQYAEFVSGYTGPNFREISVGMREGRTPTYEGTPIDVGRMFEEHGVVRPEIDVIYRGLTGDHAKGIARKSIGDVYSDLSLQSFTESRAQAYMFAEGDQMAGGVILKYKPGVGEKMLEPGYASRYQGEMEYILPPGEFRIKAIREEFVGPERYDIQASELSHKVTFVELERALPVSKAARADLGLGYAELETRFPPVPEGMVRIAHVTRATPEILASVADKGLLFSAGKDSGLVTSANYLEGTSVVLSRGGEVWPSAPSAYKGDWLSAAEETYIGQMADRGGIYKGYEQYGNDILLFDVNPELLKVNIEEELDINVLAKTPEYQGLARRDMYALRESKMDYDTTYYTGKGSYVGKMTRAELEAYSATKRAGVIDIGVGGRAEVPAPELPDVITVYRAEKAPGTVPDLGPDYYRVTDEARYAALEQLFEGPSVPLLGPSQALIVPEAPWTFAGTRVSGAKVSPATGKMTLWKEEAGIPTFGGSRTKEYAGITYDINKLSEPPEGSPIAWTAAQRTSISKATTTRATLDPYTGTFTAFVSEEFKLSPARKAAEVGPEYRGGSYAYQLNIFDLPMYIETPGAGKVPIPDTVAITKTIFREQRMEGLAGVEATRTSGTYGIVSKSVVREGVVEPVDVIHTREINKAFETLMEAKKPVEVEFGQFAKGTPKPAVVKAAKARDAAAAATRAAEQAMGSVPTEVIDVAFKGTGAKKEGTGPVPGAKGTGGTILEGPRPTITMEEHLGNVARDIMRDITPAGTPKASTQRIVTVGGKKYKFVGKEVTPESTAKAMEAAQKAHAKTLAKNAAADTSMVDKVTAVARRVNPVRTVSVGGEKFTYIGRKATEPSAARAMSAAKAAHEKTVEFNKQFVGSQISDVLEGKTTTVRGMEPIVDTTEYVQFSNAMLKVYQKEAEERRIAMAGFEPAGGERALTGLMGDLAGAATGEKDINRLIRFPRPDERVGIKSMEDINKDINRRMDKFGTDIFVRGKEKEIVDTERWERVTPIKDVTQITRTLQDQITDQFEITKPWEETEKWKRKIPDEPKIPPMGIGFGGGAGGWPVGMWGTGKRTYQNPVVDIEYLIALSGSYSKKKGGGILEQFRR